MTRRAAGPLISRRKTIGLGLGAMLLAGGLKVRLALAAEDNAAAATDADHDDTKILLTIAGDDGSATTIIPEIVEQYLVFRGASAIRSAKADAPWTTEISGTMLNGDRVAVLIRASSSTDGLSLLSAGMADIGLSLREAGPAELPGLTAPGGDDDMSAVRAIARNAMVLIVNKKTRISALSFDDARAIFSGKITDWAQIGGTPGPIHYFGRAIDYRSSNLVGSMMGGEAIGGGLHIVPSYDAMRDAVAADASAIGYVPVNFVHRQHLMFAGPVTAVRFRLGKRLTASPDDYGIATGDYPLVFPHLLYRVPDRENGEVDTFFQQAISVSAHVIDMFAGLTFAAPRLLVPPVDPSLPEQYRDVTRNALRVSTTIRFGPESKEVTGQTRSSLDELAEFLRKLDVSRERLRHVVFSEDSGNAEKNEQISEQLGAVFARELKDRNVRTGDIVPLGAILPLAGEASPLGRFLNRRVETWVTP